jgi:hypothetical protein
MKIVDTRQRESPNQGRTKRYINFVMPLRGIKTGIGCTLPEEYRGDVVFMRGFFDPSDTKINVNYI